MIKEKYLIIAFETTTNALYAEKMFKENNCDGRIFLFRRQLTQGADFVGQAKKYLTKAIGKKLWKKTK